MENKCLWEKLRAGKSHNMQHQVSIVTICILLLYPVVDRHCHVSYICAAHTEKMQNKCYSRTVVQIIYNYFYIFLQ